MNIIILILIALGSLVSSSQFNESFKQTHQADIQKATAIYNAGSYTQVEGGVVIDEDGNP